MLKPTAHDLGWAIAIAAQAHKNMVDKAGRPYFLHPMRMVLTAFAHDFGYEVAIVAALHDVVEDYQVHMDHTAVWDALVLTKKLSLLDGLLAVTRKHDGSGDPAETYREFVKRAARDPIGKKVKTLDIQDHLDMAFDEETRKMAVTRYGPALRFLMGDPFPENKPY